jgi:glyoxylase-like metal-dependent hydrolase (beta-lactamase superfamily II)
MRCVDARPGNHWQVGGVGVTRIEERMGPSGFAPEQFMTGYDRAVLLEHLHLMPGFYAPEQNRFISSMHSWLLRVDGLRILVDTCCGNHKERPWFPAFHQLDTPYLENLRAEGLAPEDIDFVLCTHLHLDHIGWNTRLSDGRWVPTFPNARYLFSDREDRRWNPSRNPATDPNRAEAYGDSVLPVVKSGQAQLLPDGAHALGTRLRIEPTPGHTPGHVSLKLEDEGRKAIFSGDVLHHPIQVYRPDWNSYACEEPELARRTRREVLAWCADEGALLFPAHFAAPHVAAIRRTPEGFAPVFVPGS